MSGKREMHNSNGEHSLMDRQQGGQSAPKRRVNKVIGALWIVLGCLLVAVVALVYVRDKAGRQAGWAADTLLSAINEQSDVVEQLSDPEATPEPLDEASAMNVTYQHEDDDGALMSGDPYAQPDAPEMDEAELQAIIDTIASSVGKDGVIGVLSIPEIEVELPIIGQWSTKLLKVSICRYQGGDPNTPGNLVVIGHNYKNGSHFGRLKNLEEGDELFLTDMAGVQKRYVVYEMVTVAPDDFSALEPYRGECGLTLMTCYKDGTNRLFVRCEQVDAET